MGFDPDVASLNIAVLLQLTGEALHRRQGLRCQQADAPHPLALLRPRSDRPRGCHAA